VNFGSKHLPDRGFTVLHDVKKADQTELRGLFGYTLSKSLPAKRLRSNSVSICFSYLV
jgi:hypothetical protein